MNTLHINPMTTQESPQPLPASATTIDLKYPVTFDGMTVDQLTLRRPRVRDRLAAEKSSGSDIEKEIRLIANLCDLAPQQVELLDLADYTRLQACLTDFLS